MNATVVVAEGSSSAARQHQKISLDVFTGIVKLFLERVRDTAAVSGLQ